MNRRKHDFKCRGEECHCVLLNSGALSEKVRLSMERRANGLFGYRRRHDRIDLTGERFRTGCFQIGEGAAARIRSEFPPFNVGEASFQIAEEENGLCADL